MSSPLGPSSSTSLPDISNPPLELSYRPMASHFISGAISPTAPEEWAAFGTRGDGKTWAAAGVMIGHAQQHHAAGYPLPVQWMGATDTFEAHKSKTHGSLLEPTWRGTWRLKDQGHVAEFTLQGTVLVALSLFGVEDQSGMDRLRRGVHAMWFEEPAPTSVLVQSSGMSDSAWAVGITSCRMPSYKHPKIMTLNYPDEDHWTWQRFVIQEHPGTAYVRIPPGERASEADRAEWARALAGRPDLLRRLLAGEPGVVALGPEVALGYNPVAHVARRTLILDPHQPLYVAWDSGVQSHAHCTLVGQRIGAELRVYAGLVSEATGLKQHLEQTVIPWFTRHAPWALDAARAQTYHAYDPAMDVDEGTDIDSNPLLRCRAVLKGAYEPGAVSWAGRQGPMLAAFNAGTAGAAALQIDPGPDTDLLRKALSGRWYYKQLANGSVVKDLPHKPNHPWEDLGDTFCYLLGRMAPSRPVRDPSQKLKPSKMQFNPVAVGAR